MRHHPQTRKQTQRTYSKEELDAIKATLRATNTAMIAEMLESLDGIISPQQLAPPYAIEFLEELLVGINQRLTKLKAEQLTRG